MNTVKLIKLRSFVRPTPSPQSAPQQLMTIRRNTLKKVSFITHISFTIIALLLITSCDRSKPPATAPLEVTVVKKIFLSLMDLSARQYGITPIDNLRSPQSLKDFVRSFSSLALFKKSLEKSFAQNRFSYSKTLHNVAAGGVSVLMDFEGGPGAVILLAMPC